LTRAMITIVALALLAAACGGSDDGSTGIEGSTLVIYSGRSEDLIGPLVDQFAEETGVDVQIRYAGSAELAATLLEEGSGSPADVFFAQDPASLGAIALAGMLSTLPTGTLSTVPEAFSDRDGHWVGTSGRARVVVYDTTRVTPDEIPATEDGFVDQEWKGRLGVAPTNGSFLAFVAAKILLDGEAATLAWLQGIAANDAPTYPKNSAIVAAVDEGQVDTGLVNHYYLFRRTAELGDLLAENHFFGVATAGSMVMPAGAGILESAANPGAALAFIEFLLSTAAQEYFASETFEYPLVPGVEPFPGLPALASIPTPDLNLSELATVLDLATDLVAEAGLL